MKWTEEEEEKRNFTATKDRLVEEESRRRSGDFYTPAVWAHEAHKMLDAELGPDWREEWVTWDCACGTSNLTRDYAFSELYLSTLFQDDVDTIESMGYNPGSTKFQFDFLNDPFPGQEDLVSQFQGQRSKIPAALQTALEEGKKMVFLINPPFGTAQAGTGMGTNKDGVSSTVLKDSMDLGGANQQLYAQFMFRITELVEKYDLEDAVFALYSVPLFLSGSSFKKFREYFYQKWEFKNGFLFRADEFNGTSSSWGVSHTFWRKGEENNIDFDLTLKKRDEHGIVQKEGTKNFYYPTKNAKKWIKAPRKMWWGKGSKDGPQFTSAIVLKGGTGKNINGDLGNMLCNSNNVAEAPTGTALFSGPFAYAKRGLVNIFPQNFRRCLALFTARKTVKSNWINQKDEYCAPNENHPEYEQWVNDCHVYSLFHSSSQQSSLRDIDYGGKKWDIENEFFWMSSDEMKDLADQYGFDEMYQDAVTFGSSDRYMYEQLEGMKLSEDAQELLDEARSLVRDSMEMRVTAFYEKPEQHLQAWDAGWYQIRNGILKDYYPERYEAFGIKYRALEDRLRESVYKFGFLRS